MCGDDDECETELAAREAERRGEAHFASADALREACAIDRPGSLGGVSKRKKGEWRVSVVKPRPGRDRGEWCLRIRGAGKDTRILSGLSATEENRAHADALARRRELELNGGKGTLTVGEVYERWLQGRNGAANSRRNELGYGKVLGGLDLNLVLDGRLTSGEIAKARRALTAEDPETGRARRVSSARAILYAAKQAWTWGLVEGAVFQPWPVMPPWNSPRGERQGKRALTDEELHSLIDFMATCSKGRYHLLTQLMAQSASRITETLSLRVSDVVDRGDFAEVTYRKTKTGVVRKSLITSTLGGALVAAAREGWLFPVRDASKAMPPANFWHAMRKWVVKHGLQGEVEPHSIRRWACGRLHSARVPVELAKLVTGHVDSKTYLEYASRSRYEVLGASKLLWAAMAPAWPTAGEVESQESTPTTPSGAVSEDLPSKACSAQSTQPLGGLQDPTRAWNYGPAGELRKALATRRSSLNLAIQALRGLGDPGQS